MTKNITSRLSDWRMHFVGSRGQQNKSLVNLEIQALKVRNDQDCEDVRDFLYDEMHIKFDGYQSDAGYLFVINKPDSIAKAIELFDQIAKDNEKAKPGKTSKIKLPPKFHFDISEFPEKVRESAYIRAVANHAGRIELNKAKPIDRATHDQLIRYNLCLTEDSEERKDEYEAVVVRCRNAEEAKGLVRYWHNNGWAAENPYKAARRIYEILLQERESNKTSMAEGSIFVHVPPRLAKEAIENPKNLQKLPTIPGLKQVAFDQSVALRFPYIYKQTEIELHKDHKQYINLMKSCLLRECGVNIGVNKVEHIDAINTDLLPQPEHLFKIRNNPKNKQGILSFRD